MNKILLPASDIAAIYLDDVLLHAKTPEEALTGLRDMLILFRGEGLKLNIEKCSLLMTSVTFLGFEIGNSANECSSGATIFRLDRLLSAIC